MYRVVRQRFEFLVINGRGETRAGPYRTESPARLAAEWLNRRHARRRCSGTGICCVWGRTPTGELARCWEVLPVAAFGPPPEGVDQSIPSRAPTAA